MAKLRKVYVPRWTGWFVAAVTLPMWLWLTWETFFADPSSREMTPAGWLVMTVVLALVVGVVFLMATRRLPAYLVEEEE